MDAPLDEMITSGEIGLVNQVLADRRAFYNVSTQAGDWGVAANLWP